MDFQIKKLAVETLGEYLVHAREHVGLTREVASRLSGVKLEYLIYLENQEFEKLPAEVYVCGFLTKIADVYKIDAQEMVSQFKKECGVVLANNKVRKDQVSSLKEYFGQVVLTPKVLGLVSAGLALLLICGYLIVQVIFLSGAPVLSISEPVQGQLVKGLFVDVVGVTDAGSVLKINDQGVFVSGDGSFRVTIGVVPGQKELSVVAENKFGKKTEKKILVIVE
jgi:hypothetical protein